MPIENLTPEEQLNVFFADFPDFPPTAATQARYRPRSNAKPQCRRFYTYQHMRCLRDLGTVFGDITSYEDLAVHAKNFKQGYAGTCSFLAAIGAVLRKPNLARKVFPDLEEAASAPFNNQMAFHAKLRRFHKFVDEFVDLFFPSFAKHLVGCSTSTSGQVNGTDAFLFALLEKMYAKRTSSWAVASRGGTFKEACHMLMHGYGVTHRPLNNDKMKLRSCKNIENLFDPVKLLEIFHEGEEKNALIGLGTACCLYCDMDKEDEEMEEDDDEESMEEEIDEEEEETPSVLPNVPTCHWYIFLKQFNFFIKGKPFAITVFKNPHGNADLTEDFHPKIDGWDDLPPEVRKEIGDFLTEPGVVAVHTENLAKRIDQVDVYFPAPGPFQDSEDDDDSDASYGLDGIPPEMTAPSSNIGRATPLLQSQSVMFEGIEVLMYHHPPATLNQFTEPFFVRTPEVPFLGISTFAQAPYRKKKGYYIIGLATHLVQDEDELPSKDELLKRIDRAAFKSPKESCIEATQVWDKNAHPNSVYGIVPTVSRKAAGTFCHTTMFFLNPKKPTFVCKKFMAAYREKIDEEKDKADEEN